MATGTIERIVSHTETETFDFDALCDRVAAKDDWSEETYAAAAKMENITVFRSGTAAECSIYFTVDGIEYGVEGVYVLGPGCMLSRVRLSRMETLGQSGGEATTYTIPDDLFDLLHSALDAIAGEAW